MKKDDFDKLEIDILVLGDRESADNIQTYQRIDTEMDWHEWIYSKFDADRKYTYILWGSEVSLRVLQTTIPPYCSGAWVYSEAKNIIRRNISTLMQRNSQSIRYGKGNVTKQYFWNIVSSASLPERF